MDVLKKTPVREQDAKVRATNFEEVCLGYNKDEAMEEAKRLAERYNMELDDFLNEFGGIEMVQYDGEMRKTIELLKELNK